MNIDIKKVISSLILAIGLIFFFWTLSNNNINLAMVVFTGTLILWLMYAILLEYFDVTAFARLLSAAGILLALAVFFLYGVEELPYPIGAFVFHTSGIAGALGIGFFSILPMVFLYQLGNSAKQEKTMADKETIPEEEPLLPVIESDDWEFATEEELQSEEWETA